jgi:hypothetical protein
VFPPESHPISNPSAASTRTGAHRTRLLDRVILDVSMAILSFWSKWK